eukprot:5588995-Prymnesium_polylepis.2
MPHRCSSPAAVTTTSTSTMPHRCSSSRQSLPNGLPPNGLLPNGLPQSGLLPNGLPPNGLPQSGRPPTVGLGAPRAPRAPLLMAAAAARSWAR